MKFMLVFVCMQTVLGESLRFDMNTGSNVLVDFESVRVRQQQCHRDPRTGRAQH